MMFVGLFLLFLILRINAHNICADERAICVNIRNCPPIMEILRGPRPLSQEVLAALRNSNCGFEGFYPKVCCINQDTVTPVPELHSLISPISQTSEQTNTDVSDPPDVTNHPNLHLLELQSCGFASQNKILRGNLTDPFENPWMALIMYNIGRETSKFRCGGTIINRRYILTAAHCVTSLPDDITVTGVRIGEHDLGKEQDCDRDIQEFDIVCREKYEDLGIESIHPHPQYTISNLQNDIALIRLNSTMVFGQLKSSPICLPFGSSTRYTRKKALVTGWGTTESGPRHQVLLQEKLSLITTEQCANIYRDIVWYKQICAGNVNITSSCKSDDGGPLQAVSMYNNNRVRVVQYGVASYASRQCDNVGFPGVYTNVSYYMDWILDTIRE